MATGRKTGGRIKGISKNKVVFYDVGVRIKQLGIDLVENILLEIKLMDKPADKARCYLQLLEYCAPKLKNVEVTDTTETGQDQVKKDAVVKRLDSAEIISLIGKSSA